MSAEDIGTILYQMNFDSERNANWHNDRQQLRSSVTLMCSMSHGERLTFDVESPG
jgi:hypothetical protein